MENTRWTKSRMYVSVLLGLLLMVLEGTIEVWASPMLKKLNSTSPDNPLGRLISDDEFQWLGSINIPGVVVGAFCTGWLTSFIGRKPLLILTGLPTFIFFVLMSFTNDIVFVYLGRILGGVGFGGVSVVLPIYICELAHPSFRGRLCALTGVCLNLGVLIMYSGGPFLTFKWFHAGLAVVMGVFMLLFLLFGLETPHYYIRSNEERAEEILREIRGKTDVSEEKERIKNGLRETERGTIIDVFKSRGTRKALFIGLGITLFNFFTGSAAIAAYAQTIFDQVDQKAFTSEVNTIIMGACQFVVSCFTSPISDNFGRKTLLATSYFGISLMLGIFGLYNHLSSAKVDLSGFKWVSVLSLSIYIVAYNLGVRPFTRNVTGELFPLRVKGAAIALITILGAGAGFLVNFRFRTVQKLIGLDFVFWAFSGVAFFAFIFILVFMVETKGKTLEEIQDELNGRKRNNDDVE